jgi:hypothetical protein
VTVIAICCVTGWPFAAASVHLERLGPEPAHDERAVAVRLAIEQALLVRAHVVAADEEPVGMRVVVQVHVLGLRERCLDRVAAGRGVGAVPVAHRGSRRHVQRIAILRELRVLQLHASARFGSVDLAHPAGDLDAAIGDGAGLFLTLHRGHGDQQRQDSDSGNG